MRASDLKLLDPIQVIGLDGEVFIYDDFYARIFKVSQDGILTSIAGNGTGAHFVDNSPASGSISNCQMAISKATGDIFFGCTYGIFKLEKATQMIHAMTSKSKCRKGCNCRLLKS